MGSIPAGALKFIGRHLIEGSDKMSRSSNTVLSNRHITQYTSPVSAILHAWLKDYSNGDQCHPMSHVGSGKTLTFVLKVSGFSWPSEKKNQLLDSLRISSSQCQLLVIPWIVFSFLL